LARVGVTEVQDATEGHPDNNASLLGRWSGSYDYKSGIRLISDGLVSFDITSEDPTDGFKAGGTDAVGDFDV
jgi:hypothetical protein